ncbi:ATP synthase F1 subunit gamma [bacterium]|nr:ATP synthase F1 subunit gamma [bacterium]
MATLRDIRKRIEAAANIRKITQTMERISAVRVMRSNRRLEKTREYSTALKDIAADLFYTGIQDENSFRDICLLHSRKEIKEVGIVVVTSNQGMCGGFNYNIIQEAERVYQQFCVGKNVPKVFAVGKKGIQHFRNMGIRLHFACDQYSDKFSYDDIRALGQKLIISLETGDLDEVFIVYNHLESSSIRGPVVEALLPCDEFLREIHSPEKKKRKLFVCEPNVHDLIDAVLPELVINRLFQAVLESIVSEHISRRLAMQQASVSAKDMITEMRNRYHALRKSKITRELNEIMGTILALQRD